MDSRTVLSPTRPMTKGGGEERKQLQLSKTSWELLDHLKTAQANGAADASVFGAAMQRCGQNRWWDCLREVRAMQQASGVRCGPLLLGQYLSALAKCARGEKGFGVVPARQAQLVPLGRQAWDEVAPDIDRVTAGTALSLCAAAAAPPETSSLLWADEVHAWSCERGLRLSVAGHTAYAHVLEAHCLSGRVDQLLRNCDRNGWRPDAVFLGGMVNVAAERRDWERADELWRMVIEKFQVKPHSLAYGALAKAHLVSGRPCTAAHVIDEMLKSGCELTSTAAQLHIQALLLVYHSSLAREDLQRLEGAFRRGTPVIQQASAWERKTAQEMLALFGRMRASPDSVRLHDALIEWKASQSVMATWRNHSSGSAYLADEQVSRL